MSRLPFKEMHVMHFQICKHIHPEIVQLYDHEPLTCEKAAFQGNACYAFLDIYTHTHIKIVELLDHKPLTCE